MGMGSLAQLLKRSGHRVSGSDNNFYPPMSDTLKDLGIDIKQGFAAGNIPADTDLVILGNAVKKSNPEAQETMSRGIRYYSFPQALEELYLKDKRPIVVAGTHGKTTTSMLTAWILAHAGLDPGFLVGGISLNFNASSNLGGGDFFVVEGDEYDTAFFDKGPKFLHYRPNIGVLTSVDFDHADIFEDINGCKKAFGKFIDLIPKDGRLIACMDDKNERAVQKERGGQRRILRHIPGSRLASPLISPRTAGSGVLRPGRGRGEPRD
jgi:UDP-N-acetylmuramate: L-alanyl-gamma-D-glutamyl-meso-diaminopimelate ligase